MIERGQTLPSRTEIEAMTDAARLALLYRDTVEMIEEIKSQIFGMRTAGVAEEAWLQRVGKKVGYLRMCSRWAELRMLALELPVPYLPSDPRMEELRRQADTIKRLHRALEEAGVPIPETSASRRRRERPFETPAAPQDERERNAA